MNRSLSVWVTAVMLWMVLAGCAKHEAAPEVVRPVLTQKVEPTRAVDKTAYSGEVRARHETDLGFRIGGKIIERKVDVGAEVKKGTLLARLDPADAKFTADAARSQVAAAQTEFDYASSELVRYKTLLDKGFIGQSAFEAKQNSYNSAKAKLAAARSQAGVNINQSAYTSLYADDDGVITSVTGEVGQVVAAGLPVMRLARPQEKEVLINAAESKIDELRQSQQMLVRLWAYPDKIFQGRVREIAPNADTATRTFSVKVTILDPGPEVKLGMTATVLAGGADVNTVVLPLTAIYSQNGKAGVWIVDPQTSKVSLRNVELGQYRENGVTIVSGLNAGENVVIVGVHKLVPGQVVRMAQPVGSENKT